MSKNQQRTRTDFLCLTISAGTGTEEREGTGPNYRYTVGVQSDATGARIRFTYHDSQHNHGRGIDQLNREGLLYAFWSFVSDADAGAQSFHDFCQDFGYDEDSIRHRRTWEACKASAAKLERLFHDHREPGALLELLALEGIE